jgi:enoyl-CoA hydratase/carnithine racemase
VITASQKFLSSGTDLREIAALDAAKAFTFAGLSQELMGQIEPFPLWFVPLSRATAGAGALDLTLCLQWSDRHRLHAIFGHRGAA